VFAGVPGDLEYVWPVRSPVVLERERKRQERAAERHQRDLARARLRRSEAAKRGWLTRQQRVRDQTDG